MQDAYQLDEHDRVLQKTPFSFDVSVWEFFWPLMTGARLVVAPPEVHKDPVYLAELIERTGITTLHFVPSMLQSFLDQHRPGQCPSLRHIVCSGEELPSTLQMKCFEHLPQAQLSNLYGPTEAAVDVTAWECSPNDRGARVPIGRPISNIQMYVLDRRGQPAPIGVSGEIFIGGVGVGRGYWNRPELTAERFVDDPFHGPSDNRLYKTGDLGRWRADGTLEYLGRNDSQVKVRGFRIELGEIEAQLLRHELVKEAVVLAREETAGEKRLVAYVVAQSAQGSPPGVEALRNHLKSTLPEHMVPSAFVLLDRFPLSPNGKLDRRALPAPGQGAYLSREYAAPEGEVEEILAGIWQSLLRVERVGRRDNFFELGGHSLLIVQMLERLRRVGLSAELRRVFESATLADLANELLRGGAAQTYEVPPNRIPEGCERITPEMLPLVQLEQEHIERIVSCVPGGATNIQDIYPLTALQEGILFHHMLDQHGSSADIYARSVVFSVSSQEVLEKFILALQGVIDRHDILRTAVVWEHLPQPLQVVLRRASLSVRETAVERLDLRRAPLMRLEVTADPKQRGSYYATLQTHHLVIDNESIDILVAEVMAYLEGRAGELPEAQPYRNHVAQVISQARAHDVEVFFRDKLHDVDESSAAFGLVDVHAEGRQIAHAHHELDSALAHTLRLQARHLGVSAATLFHAAWALVISQTTGREDVVYGTVLSGRLHGSAGAQRILGMFINTLPLRLRLEGTSVKQLVERTQRELVDLLGYEQASLAVAQRCSGISGSAPLFNALINYRHNPADQATQWFEGTGVNLLTSGGGTNYPIVLSVNDLEEGFGLDVEVDQRLDPQRLLGYVATALQSLSLALDGDGKVAALALSVLPSSERRLLIERFNGTEEEGHSRQKLIHQLFEEQVERTPLAQAVVYEGRSLTFAELNARANQLAHYLRERGVVADQLVGLCVERSLDLVVGLLGILKAGGAYLPLDPTHPPERLSYMLQDAAPRLLLTQGHLRGKLPLIEDQILSLDEEWEAAIAPRPVSNPQASGVTADGLAYVIYTSGSTGQPKGVLIEHRNVVNHWQALESLYRQPYDCRRIALNAPVTFDASVQQWVQLLSGCTLVIVPAAARLDAQLFQDFLGQYQIEGIDCTPSQLSTWVSAGLLDKGDSPLRTVLVGGEPIDAALWTRLERSAVSSYNVYGPTECTVDSTAAVLQGQSSDPHIGRPLRNTRVYLLDARRNPVPMGVPGELYIGGAGVARGYLKRVELTAQRFVEDPFSPHPQARMYQTGDLGRWREDGTIEYLGRNDTQVKLRGYRIELGEIEAQLTRLDEVKEAVVVVREDVPGDKRLVAYVVPTASAPASAEALREELSRSLPDYMVPSAFVTLKSLPLTPNGKLDRRALPAPELGAYTSRQYEPPRGEVEELLATIWQELLRVERVGRGDNFFELGGHSLLATRVMTRIRHDIDVDLPLRVLFAAPTIEALGRRILTEIATDMSLEAS
jgi:amino acid adenylation domain-containing protein